MWKQASSSLKVLCDSKGQHGMGRGRQSKWRDVDKVLGLLERVCRRPLYEMIASVGSEWRFGGIDLRLLGCLFVFPTVPWRSDLWLWRR